jgi:hypothetical protein
VLTVLLIVHGLIAVALLGAITHQTLAVLLPVHGRSGSLVTRFRAVFSPAFANTVVLLYIVSAVLGGTIYLWFRTEIRPDLERAGAWTAIGVFDLKEHFVSIGFALLPAYWMCWRRPSPDVPPQTRTALTATLAFIVWWGFIVGHVLNNILGFGR